MSPTLADIASSAFVTVLPHAIQIIQSRADDHDHDHDHDHSSTSSSGGAHAGHSHGAVLDANGQPICGSIDGRVDTLLGLRIAAIFIILIGSSAGALFPVLAKRSKWLHVPKSVFDFAKYFGSGVIIATAFIHLLAHGLMALESECLSEGWHEYPYGMALVMLAIFFIFIIELVAFRWGTTKLKSINAQHDVHGHGHGSHAAHGPEGGLERRKSESSSSSDVESLKAGARPGFDESALTQIVGILILEFGVALHRFFQIETFEGLGIGSRLAYMKLSPKYHWVPVVGAMIYGITTPIGIAAGLGVRSTYNPGSTTASIVSGVMDCLSAGILIYTGLVELLAHEFLFNKEMMNGSNGRLAYAVCCMLLGCAVMALLGKWA